VASERLTEFGRALRAEGLPVGPGRIEQFCRAAALAPGELYWAGRATLVSRASDLPVYDEVFGAFFGGEPAAAEMPPQIRVRGQLVEEVEVAIASSVELLREKSFADCTPEELEQLAALVRFPAPQRRSRRAVPSRRGSPDLRRTIRRSFRTGGDPLERAWRQRRRRPRRLVLLLDVSGSMADYSRALLLFAHALLRNDPRWEAFVFGTRLTRLTRELGAGKPGESLERAAAAVFDWSGGTRIGESLKAFLDEYGHRSVARGAVVMVCSDGLELGDPELLREQAARLSRLAHRLVWLNPLLADPAYEPLARGMAAALPHVDEFRSGHNLASLEELAASLG
jgi:uncharacterized protein